eukprot:scaffold1954_cov364-Prasinococcus_capsulatus_cf.AAC.8
MRGRRAVLAASLAAAGLAAAACQRQEDRIASNVRTEFNYTTGTADEAAVADVLGLVESSGAAATKYSISSTAREGVGLLFAEMDLDGDALLSYNEFVTGLLAVAAEGEDKRHARRRVGQRSEGTEELVEELSRSRAGTESARAQQTPAESRAGAACQGSASALECLFDSCDVSRDGFLESSEFERALVKWEEELVQGEADAAVGSASEGAFQERERAHSSCPEEAGSATPLSPAEDGGFDAKWLKAVQSSECILCVTGYYENCGPPSPPGCQDEEFQIMGLRLAEARATAHLISVAAQRTARQRKAASA